MRAIWVSQSGEPADSGLLADDQDLSERLKRSTKRPYLPDVTIISDRLRGWPVAEDLL
jgi:hypothetical protein